MKNKKFRLTEYNIHRYNFFVKNRLSLAAVLISIKYNEDHYFDNKFYSRVGGVSLTELNFLEKEMLYLLNYELYISSETYEKYLNEIYKNSIEDESVCMDDIKYVDEDKDTEIIPSVDNMRFTQ